MIAGLKTSNTFLCKVQWKQWLCKKKGYEKVNDNLKTKQKMDVRKRVRQTMHNPQQLIISLRITLKLEQRNWDKSDMTI